MRSYPKSKRFDPKELPDLIAQYRGEELSGEFPWIGFLDKETVRTEIILRFQRLIATMVSPCVTGRVHYYHRYQLSFLRKWAGSSTPLENVAKTLKGELSDYSQEELMRIGEIAIVQALERTRTNLASTIVTCFKDLLFELTKNRNSHMTGEFKDQVHEEEDFTEAVHLQIALEGLSEHDKEIVREVMLGDREDLPEHIKEHLKDYFS